MTDKVKKEIDYYEEVRAGLQEALDAEFLSALVKDEEEIAYSALDRKLKYGLTDNMEHSVFLYEKSITEPRKVDLDKYKASIPCWAYADIAFRKKLRLETIEHWGKRVEGAYSGDVVVPSREMNLMLSLAREKKRAENIVEYMHRLVKESGAKNFNLEDIKEIAKAGVYRVIDIEVDGPCILANKNIGAALIKATDTWFDVWLALNYDAIVNNWLNMKDTVSKLSKAIKNMTGIKDKDSIVVRLLCDPKPALDRQRAMMASNEAKNIEREKGLSGEGDEGVGAGEVAGADVNG